MKRFMVTCFVGLGIVLAGAAQTAWHQKTHGKQASKVPALQVRW